MIGTAIHNTYVTSNQLTLKINKMQLISLYCLVHIKFKMPFLPDIQDPYVQQIIWNLYEGTNNFINSPTYVCF